MSRLLRNGLFLATVIVASCAGQMRAAEVSAKVTYVAWRTLYLNAGRVQGVQGGANGLLYHESKLLGEITVAAVAESTCVAALSGDSVIASPGDDAVILVVENDRSDSTTSVTLSETQVAAPLVRPASKRRVSASRLTGRASLQTDMYRSEGATEIYPGATFRSTISRIVTNHSQFSLKYRGRQRTKSDTRVWQHRLYEADLSFESPKNVWRASIGRVQAGSVAGIGYLDGAYGEISLGRGVAAGAFGGAQSDIDLSVSDFGTTKGGVLITHRRNESVGRRSQMTLAMAGEYVDRNISREFLYQQYTLGLGSAFSFYESSDFNINRGWRRDAEGSIVSLANVLANVRYSPSHVVSFSAGYDGRARYHDWETRETPDSLFDDAMRHGLRGGAELTLLRGTRLSAQQTYRSEPSTDEFYPSTSYTLASNALLIGTVGATMRYNTFTNPYSTGELRSLSASWTVVRNADLRAEYGQTHYDFRHDDYRSDSEWIRASLDLNLRSGTYLSFQTEQNRSNDESTMRAFVELGQRFR